MAHLFFYHPNAKNTGSAANFFVGNDNGLWLRLTKQVSWNPEKKTGSFQANAKNPDGNVLIKFSQTEVGGLLLLLEKGTEFSAFHGSKDRTVQFTAKLWKKEGDPTVFGTSFSAYKTPKQDSTLKASFGIALSLPETMVLKHFVTEALKRTFENPPDEKQEPKANEEPAETSAPSPEVDF